MSEQDGSPSELPYGGHLEQPEGQVTVPAGDAAPSLADATGPIERASGGRVFAGRFQLLARRGTATDVALFEAVDMVTERSVAVKIVHPDICARPGFEERFTTTMQAVARTPHPNLTEVIDIGSATWSGRTVHYVVCENLTGGSLRDLRDRGRQLSPSQVVMIGIDACRGLDNAHRAGFVHGDIRPANLVFGGDGRLRLADIGLAQLVSDSWWVEPTGVNIEKARFASPEQAQGQEPTTKSDVYALCLCLLEAVTGQLPFVGDSSVATLSNRVDKLLPVSADLGPLAAVLERAGRPDSDDRSSASEFGRALHQAAEKLPRPAPLALVSGGLFASAPAAADPTSPSGMFRRPDASEPVPGVPTVPTRTGESVPTDGPVELAVVAATPDHAAEPEAGVPEAGVPEAGVPEAGVPEAGVLEAGVLEAGVLEAANGGAPGAAGAAGTGEEGEEGAAGAAELPVKPWLLQPTRATPIAPTSRAADAPGPTTSDVTPPTPVDSASTVASGIEPATDATPLASTGGAPAAPVSHTPDTPLTPVTAASDVGAEVSLADVVHRHAPDAPGGITGSEAALPPPELADAVPTHAHRPRRTRFTLVAVLLAVGVVGAGLFAWFGRTESNDVPELSLLEQGEALNMVSEFGWNVLTVDEADDEIAVGVVIRTDPPAGTTLEEGDDLTLVVSTGPAPRVLPEVVGATVEQATADLLELGLVLEIGERAFSDSVPVDEIISWTVPDQPALAAGDTVLPGTAVVVVVSSGPEPRAVPDVSALPLAEATAAIEVLDLVVAVTVEEFSLTVPAGSVIAQEPVPGTAVEPGTTVAIVVSKGPDLVPVPPLAGLDVQQATDALATAGLGLGQVKGDPAGVNVLAEVGGVSIGGGATFPRGTLVDLTFEVPPPATEVLPA